MKDVLVATTTSGNILLLDSTTLTFSYIKRGETRFNDFCLIYPTGETVVTLAHNNELSSWATADGALKHTIRLKRTALVINSNPDFPYIAVGYTDGLLELFSLYTPEKITAMTRFQLTTHPINSISFTEISRNIVAADTNTGQFFVIEVQITYLY